MRRGADDSRIERGELAAPASLSLRRPYVQHLECPKRFRQHGDIRLEPPALSRRASGNKASSSAGRSRPTNRFLPWCGQFRGVLAFAVIVLVALTVCVLAGTGGTHLRSIRAELGRATEPVAADEQR